MVERQEEVVNQIDSYPYKGEGVILVEATGVMSSGAELDRVIVLR